MREYGCYFEVLLQMTLKKEASDLKLTDFNQCCPLMELLKKALQFQQQCYHKKRNSKYYSTSQTCSKKYWKYKDMDVEDKIELLI